MLSLSGITKIYRLAERPVEALVNISLELTPGQIVTVQGPSGAGKTTLLLTAGSLLSPDSGDVNIDGQNPWRLSSDCRADLRRATIGFVFQQYHLVPYLNVIENVLAAALPEVSADSYSRAEELVSRFGLSDRCDHLIGQLSTGQKQRVALARALLNSPKVILADEPTGNLDEANATIVLDALSDFAATGGAVLLVTHDKAADKYTHNRLRLEAGRFV